MLKSVFVASAVLLTGMSMAQAANPAYVVRVSDSRDAEAKFEPAAEKRCNDMLDRGAAFNYNSIEECVSDIEQKMVRDAEQGKTAPHAIADKGDHPN